MTRESALLELTTRIAAAADEPAICRAVVDGLAAAGLGYDAAGLFLGDEDGGPLRLRASVGWDASDAALALDEVPSMPARPGQAIHHSPDVSAAARRYGRAPGAVSEAVLPLRSNGETIGVLVVENVDGAFRRPDFEALTAVAMQASIAVGRLRLLATERRRLEEQKALLDTVADLSGELELSRLLTAVVQRAVSLLGVTGGELAIYDEDQEELVVVASHNIGTDSRGTRMKLGEGAMGQVASTREPLIIPDYQEWVGRSGQYTHTTARGVMVVPLLIGSRLVGALASVHLEPGRRFGPADLRLLNLFAPLAATAIHNAHLYSVERRRADEQKALLDTLADLSGELELNRLLKAVIERAVSLLRVTGGELAIYDEAQEELVVVASHNLGTDSTGRRMKLGEGAMGHVAEAREPLIIPDYQAWVGRSGQYTDSTIQSVMAAPLLIGHRLVGAIASVHSDRSRSFGAGDLRLLGMFAPLAATAIENAHLYSVERKRADEQKALLDTMADLSGELELNRLLTAVVQRAVTLLGVTGGELAIYDEEREELEVVASHSIGTDSTGTRMKLGEGAMGRVAQTREPLIISDYREWIGRSDKYEYTTARGVMVVPLLIGSRLVGALASVHLEPGRQFGPADLRLLNLFAPLAATAIENARLYTDAQRQKQYFEDLVFNSPVAIVTLGLDHTIRTCNPAFVRLFGYTEAEAVGRNLDELISPESDRAEAVAYTIQAQDEPVHGTGRRHRKDGTMVDVEILGVPVIVEGERVGVMALYHDITEVVESRQAAESANQAKSRFLASMSHELRTPLNAIIGYSEMIEEEAADRGIVDLVPDVQRIRNAGKHLLALINDILDLSKIEAGKTELFLEEFEVGALLDEVGTTVRPLVERNGNRLRLDCPAGLGSMHSDLTKVRQILLNLLSNAAKFTEAGEIGFEARRESGPDADVARVVFRVTDTGIGMTPNQLQRVFEAFAQAEASTTRKYGGTGLGLAICRHYCELLGGGIAAESDPGRGSVFTVWLPARAPAAVGG